MGNQSPFTNDQLETLISNQGNHNQATHGHVRQPVGEVDHSQFSGKKTVWTFSILLRLAVIQPGLAQGKTNSDEPLSLT